MRKLHQKRNRAPQLRKQTAGVERPPYNSEQVQLFWPFADGEMEERKEMAGGNTETQRLQRFLLLGNHFLCTHTAIQISLE